MQCINLDLDNHLSFLEILSVEDVESDSELMALVASTTDAENL